MKALTCPVCQGDLRETDRGGILVDTCARCRGVWLDRGELEKLAVAMGSQAEPQGFLGGALSAFGGSRRHRDDDDEDHYHGRRRQQSWRRRKKSLLDFFD